MNQLRHSDSVSSTRTVLIVDDYPGVLAWASRAFARAGWQALKANSGTEALEMWNSAERIGTRVQLLVTDLQSPDLDGPSLALALRANDPLLWIIGITGYAEHDAGWHGALLDRTTFLQKPMTAADLLSAANALTTIAPVEEEERCALDRNV